MWKIFLMAYCPIIYQKQPRKWAFDGNFWIISINSHIMFCFNFWPNASIESILLRNARNLLGLFNRPVALALVFRGLNPKEILLFLKKLTLSKNFFWGGRVYFYFGFIFRESNWIHPPPHEETKHFLKIVNLDLYFW